MLSPVSKSSAKIAVGDATFLHERAKSLHEHANGDALHSRPMSERRRPSPALRAAVREALARLGVERFVLGVHEAALPSAPGPETGRGSLGARGGRAFAELAADLGFDGLQLGPSGMTDRGNPSPYDGTLFSRSLLSVDLATLAESPVWARLLPQPKLERVLAGVPPGAAHRVPYKWNWDISRHALRTAWRELVRRAEEPEVAAVVQRLTAFTEEHRDWLEPDALYEALTEVHGSDDWRTWNETSHRRLWRPPAGTASAVAALRRDLLARHADTIGWWAFSQLVVDEQRRLGRVHARGLGLALYGDVQVGMSLRDAWRLQELFLPGYRLGAPPSRTNPEGQPWGFPVLHPGLVYASGAAPAQWPVSDPDAAPGPVLRFLERRFARAFADYDALRIDHPHGLVCPWVYRHGSADALSAAQSGARLLGAPAEPDHPELTAWSIVRTEQIDPTVNGWDDRRVRNLDDAQVARYATFLDRAAAAARAAGRDAGDLVCEVLSTQPLPLELVLRRHGLGRFRVTQKASLDDRNDVYRSDNARPEDWAMLATHDTPSIWAALQRWRADGTLAARARFVAGRLADDPARREALASGFVSHRGALATGMLAELLACPARNVFVFFTDLLGIAEPYNRPGVVGPENWTLRAPPDFRARYDAGCRRHQALDVAGACALALRARAVGNEDLLRRLETEPVRLE